MGATILDSAAALKSNLFFLERRFFLLALGFEELSSIFQFGSVDKKEAKEFKKFLLLKN